MPHDRQLEKAIIVELRERGSTLGARVVVTAVSGNVVLTDRTDSFADNDSAAPSVAAIPGVGEVTADVDVCVAPENDSRLLLAARRAISDAYANQNESSTNITGSAMAAALTNGLLTVTGESDWRQSPRSADGDGFGSTAAEAVSNIIDDILKMQPNCHFSISRATR